MSLETWLALIVLVVVFFGLATFALSCWVKAEVRKQIYQFLAENCEIDTGKISNDMKLSDVSADPYVALAITLHVTGNLNQDLGISNDDTVGTVIEKVLVAIKKGEVTN